MDLLAARETDFIAARDSFYMASVSEDGWPYVQHRGGPAGFLRRLAGNRIGFADYGGNRQNLSTANLAADDRVSLFLMDYPNRRRLKLIGHAHGSDDPADIATLMMPGYAAEPERAFLIDVIGLGWNCPQHITPRFTEAEIKRGTQPLVDDLPGCAPASPNWRERDRDQKGLRAASIMSASPPPISIRQAASSAASLVLMRSAECLVTLRSRDLRSFTAPFFDKSRKMSRPRCGDVRPTAIQHRSLGRRWNSPAIERDGTLVGWVLFGSRRRDVSVPPTSWNIHAHSRQLRRDEHMTQLSETVNSTALDA